MYGQIVFNDNMDTMLVLLTFCLKCMMATTNYLDIILFIMKTLLYGIRDNLNLVFLPFHLFRG